MRRVVFAAFSVALLVSAALGPHAGRAIDRWGGRFVLAAPTSCSPPAWRARLAHGPWSLFARLGVLGVGMGSGLYEAAFAALVRLYGTGSRNAITGITLIAGFASTVGWPLSALLEAHRLARRVLRLGRAHLVVGIPLNLSCRARRCRRAEPATRHPASRTARRPRRGAARRRLRGDVVRQHGDGRAPAAPAAGERRDARRRGRGRRADRPGASRRPPPRVRLAAPHPSAALDAARLLTHPLGALSLGAVGGGAAAVFAILHGAGNGILTIAKGTLPLVLFGPLGYGHRQGG